MTTEQISALAREYAEWICPYKDKSANLSILDIREAERLIHFLLRRYCLVEKSKVEETWKDITDVYLAHRHITYDGARYLFNEVLFPEIAKEVEG